MGVPHVTPAATPVAAHQPGADAPLRGCRRYIHGRLVGVGKDAGPADADAMLAGLRWLQHRRQSEALIRMNAAAATGTAAAPLPALGALARCLVQWLQEHPQRANEPVEWLLSDLLAELKTNHSADT